METVIGSSRDRDRRLNLGCRDICTADMMCWHTMQGRSEGINQAETTGGVETHVLREVTRYRERSPRKESGRNRV